MKRFSVRELCLGALAYRMNCSEECLKKYKTYQLTEMSEAYFDLDFAEDKIRKAEKMGLTTYQRPHGLAPESEFDTLVYTLSGLFSHPFA